MIVGERQSPRADDAVARRLKALACTAPLHDLDTRKSLLDWADAGVYQMSELALHAIDKVTLAMDFDHGADQDHVVRGLLPLIAAHAPDRSSTEHERVGNWVLDNLLGVGTLDRGFQLEYGTVEPDGSYVRRRFDFKLLVELAAPDGRVYLRVTDEAINVLVGALDTDVESAQVAAEVKLENLIRGGRLADARLAAEQARYRTVQYAEALRGKLEATRRDVRAVDWLAAVPELIEEALAHIESRYQAETTIMTYLADVRDADTDPERKRRAADLGRIVGDCIRRHTQLQARLQEAGATFRAEQDRQEFAGRTRSGQIDIFGQLLRPCLGLGVATAEPATTSFFGSVAGVRPVSVPSLDGLVETLLEPPTERDPFGALVPEPDLAGGEVPSRFDEGQWRRSDELLTLPGVGRRLSGLLDEARRHDEDLPWLVALRVFHALGTSITSARGQADVELCLAVDDAVELDDPEFGGSDLIVTTASVRPPREHDDRSAREDVA
ncbi:MAG TPA: hypothetical protein VFE65_30715 [Pseudonocardia sp.]|nr:hypothetical protein [Pseudonocardia sp.]